MISAYGIREGERLNGMIFLAGSIYLLLSHLLQSTYLFITTIKGFYYLFFYYTIYTIYY